MTVNHGVLGSSPCSGAIARGLQERCRSGVDSTSVERRKFLLSQAISREFSSAGSEHLPYKQRVGGSNPSTPTKGKGHQCGVLFLLWEYLPIVFTFPPPAPPFVKGRGADFKRPAVGAMGSACGMKWLVNKTRSIRQTKRTPMRCPFLCGSILPTIFTFPPQPLPLRKRDAGERKYYRYLLGSGWRSGLRKS